MIMILIRLFFAVSAVFLCLVAGLFALLLLKTRLHIHDSFMKHDNTLHRKHYADDEKVIQGEYKIIDEKNKD